MQNWVEKEIGAEAKSVQLQFARELAAVVDVSVNGPSSFAVQEDDRILLMGRVEILQARR